MRLLYTLLIIVFISPISIKAQDHTKQVAALKQSFIKKDITPVSPYLSSKLKFDPSPINTTQSILDNIIKGLPVNDITIIESEKNKAKINFIFGASANRLPASVLAFFKDSHLYFDDEGKIIRIEAIERLVKTRMASNANSVQSPNPGELSKKYPLKTIEFPSTDGLSITADLYEIDKNLPVILLCHQGGANRLEYLDIARNLNKIGYNCLAIDQRSGGDFIEKPNLTNKRAIEKGLSTEFIDAQKDIRAAIDFLQKKYNKKVIVLGSSYSATLALIEGSSNSNVKAIISISPSGAIGNIISKIQVPLLITSSKEEAEVITKSIGNIQLKNKQQLYTPKTDGFHGARILWNGQKGAEEYWVAVKAFLNKIK